MSKTQEQSKQTILKSPELKKIEKAADKLAYLKKQCIETQKAIDNFQVKIKKDNDTHAENLKKQRGEYDADTGNIRQEKERLITSITDLEVKHANLAEERKKEMADIEDDKSRCRSAWKKIKDKEQEVRAFNNEVEAKNKNFVEREASIARRDKSLDGEQARLDNLIAEYKEAEKRAVHQKTQAQVKINELVTKRAEYEKIKADSDAAIIKADEAIAKAENAEGEKAAMEIKIKGYNKRYKQLEEWHDEIKEMKRKTDIHENALRTVEYKLNEGKKKLEAAEEDFLKRSQPKEEVTTNV